MKRGATSVTDTLARLALTGLAIGTVAGVPTAFSMVPRSAAHVAPPVADEAIVDVDPALAASLTRGSDGLFRAELTIADKTLRCIVDTGASAVVLNQAEMRRLNLQPETIASGQIRTAGGISAASRVRLPEVKLAGHRFDRVNAVMVRGSATPCLIGQDLLTRLDAVEIRDQAMTLR